MQIGDELLDMHYSSNFSLLKGKRLSGPYTINGKAYQIRNTVEWRQPKGIYSGLSSAINSTMRLVNKQYTNKILVVIGEILHDPKEHGNLHWFVAAYSYDGAYCGVCEIAEANAA